MEIIVTIKYANGSQIDKEFDNVETAGVWLAGVEDQKELTNKF